MKNIYLFSEIDSSIRETLGKNACEMIDTEPNSLGFVLTQEACAEFYITREIEKDLRGRITAVLDGLCSDAGVKFGESATVSIFASTVVPMPGILEKINGVGLNESVLSTLPDEAAQKAWALHLQLMKAFACELYVSSQHFTDLENEATGKYGVDEIEKLSVEALRELCAAFKNVYAAQGVCSLSTDPYEQFFMLLKTAFRSWDNPRACWYRRTKGITDSGLSIAVQLVDLKTGKYFKNRTTIAAADRNNKEKDASNKSELQGEFKRIEIDGDLFEGYFINGKKNGRGKYIWANGNVYDGNWVDGKCTGKGRISWSSGASFDGEWKDNQMSEGKYSYADGSVYEGSFKNGKYDGYGKRIYKDGDKYEGRWQSGSRNGKGVYTWADGDVYDGEWKDDKRCGVGRMVMYGKAGPDALNAGEIFIKYSYDGEWLDNREHGHGICREGKGTVAGMDKVYEGEWVNGKKCGRFVWHFLHRDGETGKSYIDFYEDGNLIETCIPYDERIKTVEDIRRAKGKPSVASENLHHMNISNIPSCDRVKSGEYSDKVKKETEARRQYIRETVRRLRNPEENASPYYRNIENACMTLAPFMTEAENLFLKGEEEKALEIIEEMLDINIVPDDEWYYNSEIKYFSQFLSGALYSLASQIDFDTPDHDRFIVPAANIACYLWKKYGDYSLFGSVAFLWSETEKDQCGNFLWLKRMSDNGDYTVVSKYNESSEYYFGHDLDRYTMGSDCELF